MVASSCFTLASRPLALIGSVWRKLVWADAKVLHASRAYTVRTLWMVRIVLPLLRQGIEQACRTRKLNRATAVLPEELRHSVGCLCLHRRILSKGSFLLSGIPLSPLCRCVVPATPSLSRLHATHGSTRAVFLSRQPKLMMFTDEHDGCIGMRHAARDRHVLDIRQGWINGEHGTACPLDKPRPHVSHQDQRRVLKMPHLEQLPNQHRFQDRANASRRDNEGVGGEHELVQARKKGPMLKRLGHKRVDILFKG